MPKIPVYVARIDIGTSSGMIYSYDPIDEGTQGGAQIRKICKITIDTPQGFDLQQVSNPSPFGDTQPNRLLLDPEKTAQASSGRVYLRAARLIERLRSEPHLFRQDGPGVPY